MKINLICIGHRAPSWVKEGFEEYTQRLPASCRLNLIEIPLQKRTKQTDLLRLQRQEAKQMLAAIIPGSWVIALDEHGQHWDSQQLAQQLARWMQTYHTLTLLVGGPEGLAQECLQSAQQHWSLSSLTLPHQLVRIVVAEQVYRAWSLLNHHPYHR